MSAPAKYTERDTNFFVALGCVIGFGQGRGWSWASFFAALPFALWIFGCFELADWRSRRGTYANRPPFRWRLTPRARARLVLACVALAGALVLVGAIR